jgi:hypothetical protein
MDERLGCAGIKSEISTKGMRSFLARFDQDLEWDVFAFRMNKIRNPYSPFWRYQARREVAALKNQELTSLMGNIALADSPDLYKHLADKANLTASIRNQSRAVSADVYKPTGRNPASTRSLDPLILTQLTRGSTDPTLLTGVQKIFEGEPRNPADTALAETMWRIDDAYLLLAQNKITECIESLKQHENDVLAGISRNSKLTENDKRLEIEKFYLLLGLTQRLAGKLEDAATSYDKGLAQVPNSSQLKIEKASTIIFLTHKTFNGKSANKEAIDLASAAMRDEIKATGGVSSTTKERLNLFSNQLYFLGRIGDLRSLTVQLKATSEMQK